MDFTKYDTTSLYGKNITMERGEISLEGEKKKPAFLSKWTSNPVIAVLGFFTGVFSAGDWEAVCNKPGEWQHTSVQAKQVRNTNILYRGTTASYFALGRGSNLLLVARSKLLPHSVPARPAGTLWSEQRLFPLTVPLLRSWGTSRCMRLLSCVT